MSTTADSTDSIDSVDNVEERVEEAFGHLDTFDGVKPFDGRTTSHQIIVDDDMVSSVYFDGLRDMGFTHPVVDAKWGYMRLRFRA